LKESRERAASVRPKQIKLKKLLLNNIIQSHLKTWKSIMNTSRSKIVPQREMEAWKGSHLVEWERAVFARPKQSYSKNFNSVI
jgi:hypothetical protein